MTVKLIVAPLASLWIRLASRRETLLLRGSMASEIKRLRHFVATATVVRAVRPRIARPIAADDRTGLGDQRR